MYRLFEAREIDDPTRWLAFQGCRDFAPIHERWAVIHRTGSWSDDEAVRQGFRVHGVLVSNDDLDEFLETNPRGVIPELDFGPMSYGWRQQEGEYWEEDWKRTVNEIDVYRFVISFRKDAPLIDPGFIEYHDLVETEKRNFRDYETDDLVVRFDIETWQNRRGGFRQPVIDLEVRVDYLKDYLQERDCTLVLGYFQSRTHEDASTGDMAQEETINIRGGRAELDLHPTMPNVDMNWFCPIRPSDIRMGKTEALRQDRASLGFTTREGRSFTKQEAMDGEGFEEAGFRRPAIGAESREEALSFFGWLFFDSELLEKYLNDERGNVRGTSASGVIIEWSDKMKLGAYLNTKGEVVIIVDDLGKIPDSELAHWYHHNKHPEGQIPEEMIQAGLEAKWVESKPAAQQVLDSMGDLDSVFENRYQQSLFRDPPSGADPSRIGIMPRDERGPLLERMNALNQILIENLDVSALKSQIPEVKRGEVEGPKSALYEFIASKSNPEIAAEIMAPINAVYDFRQEQNHRKIEEGGWERAVATLGHEVDVEDYRVLYQDVMEGVSTSLDQIRELIRE